MGKGIIEVGGAALRFLSDQVGLGNLPDAFSAARTKIKEAILTFFREAASKAWNVIKSLPIVQSLLRTLWFDNGSSVVGTVADGPWGGSKDGDIQFADLRITAMGDKEIRYNLGERQRWWRDLWAKVVGSAIGTVLRFAALLPSLGLFGGGGRAGNN